MRLIYNDKTCVDNELIRLGDDILKSKVVTVHSMSCCLNNNDITSCIGNARFQVQQLGMSMYAEQ